MASEPTETAINAVLGAVAGATYGFIVFARKRESATRETERLDFAKLVPTVFVAGAIGAIDGAANGPNAITVAGISTRLATYAGAIFALEQVYKLLRDRYRNQTQAQAQAQNQPRTEPEHKMNDEHQPNQPVDRTQTSETTTESGEPGEPGGFEYSDENENEDEPSERRG